MERRRAKMNLAFCSICYMDHPWPSFLDKAAADGWRNLELVAMPGAFHIDANRIDAETISDELSARDIVLRAIHAGGLATHDAELCQKQIRYIERVIGLLAELGADQLVFTGGPRDKEDLDQLATALEKIAGHLEGTEVKLGLENHYQNRIETAEDYEFLFSRIGHPQIGMTADLGHFHSSGVDTPNLLRKHASRVLHVHVKDHQGTQSVPLGQGDVDLVVLLKTLKEVRYDRTVSVELEVADREKLDKYAREACQYLTNIAEEADII
jgi:sugar phosphate isomerase/epimerase